DPVLDAEVWRLNGRKGTPGEAWEKREVVGQRSDGASSIYSMCENKLDSNILNVTAPATDAAKQWDGWGTALKPAIEPIILARKPLDGTVANNVLAHGVGGLNIDASRVGMSDADRGVVDSRSGAATDYDGEGWGKRGIYPEGRRFKSAPAGRFPANVLLDEHAAKEMDKQSGWSPSNARQWKSVEGERDDPSGFLGTL